MTATGPAKRVIISVGEHVRSHGEPVYLAVLQHLLKAGVAAAKEKLETKTPDTTGVVSGQELPRAGDRTRTGWEATRLSAHER